jgi:hypothetical protein
MITSFESPQGQEVFLFFKTSRPTLMSTQLPFQWVTGVVLWEVKGLGYEAE